MKSKQSFTKAESEEIAKLINEKLKASPTKQKGIRDKIRKIGFYASDYGFRDGYTAEQFLSVAKIVDGISIEIIAAEIKAPIKPLNKTVAKSNPRSQSDESYVIDLCDELLKLKALRQHRFDFLKGDSGTKLPVDAYYPSLKLVIEFKERQHTEEVKFFDKRQTVSGVGRGEQRKLYDQRRREVLPKQGIRLIELVYSDCNCTRGKRLLRDFDSDMNTIRSKFDSLTINN